MTVQTKALFEAALSLPDSERALLADQLFQSLPPPPDELTDDQLYAELQRRDAEAENDPSVTVSWSEMEKEE
jgi:putative addiction module component (TIGR02574 family)